MADQVDIGIGFISGRPNVCKIINSYDQFIVEQLKELDITVNVTIYILYDLNYQHTIRTDFYGILPRAYKHLQIKYITPENIIEYEKVLMSRYHMSGEEAKLFIGNGYARARNTILYCAMKDKMDYILFWDDDEYPIANIWQNNKLQWIKQKNVLQHLKYIDKVDVTFGYRCGMMNPMPDIQYTDDIKEEDYKCFIDALENEVISWDKIQKIRENQGCISYADEKIAMEKVEAEYIQGIGKEKFVLGSGICLNLKNIDRIPAFYNPPNARGEDTFFSCLLKEKKAKILRIPTYHFHDSFLQFTGIMKDKFPEKLSNITLGDLEVEKRFYKTTIGWTRYKPLFSYINDRKNYRKIIDKARENLERSISKINTAFSTCDFTCLIDELNEYDKNVEKHYQEYLKVNELWDELKKKLKDEE